MSSITTYRWSLLEDVVHYRDFGFQGIGVWRTKLAEFGEERGLELLRDSDLQVSSISWVGGFTGANGFSLRESICDARETIQFAAEVDADVVVVSSGPRAGHTAKHARRLVVTALKRLAPFAAQQGVTLALMPMNRLFASEWTFLNTLDDALEIINEVDSPALQLAFDVYHLSREETALQRIPELAPQTSIVQISDSRGCIEASDDRCLPGEGSLPIGDIMTAFDENGYDGFYDVHVWSEAVWSSDYLEMLPACRRELQPACI